MNLPEKNLWIEVYPSLMPNMESLKSLCCSLMGYVARVNRTNKTGDKILEVCPNFIIWSRLPIKDDNFHELIYNLNYKSFNWYSLELKFNHSNTHGYRFCHYQPWNDFELLVSQFYTQSTLVYKIHVPKNPLLWNSQRWSCNALTLHTLVSPDLVGFSTSCYLFSCSIELPSSTIFLNFVVRIPFFWINLEEEKFPNEKHYNIGNFDVQKKRLAYSTVKHNQGLIS